jgi:thiol:disulfide interchange protein
MNRFTFLTALALASIVLGSANAGDFPKGSPKFEHRYKAALDAGKKAGKPVILIFSASWCAPCQQMKKSVYPSDAITPYHDKFVWAYLDADEPANAKPQKQYSVETIPHIEFVDGEGKSFGRQVDAATPESFAKILDGILAKVPKSATAPSGTNSESQVTK